MTASTCRCGCGEATGLGNQYIHGHNRRGLAHSEEHKGKISAAWTPERKRRSVELLNDPTIRQRQADSRRIAGATTDKGRAYEYAPTHPAAKKLGKRVLRYRLVAEGAIGRLLEDCEHVHHINLDPTDDHPDNLMVLMGSDHNRIHARMRKLGIEDHFRLWFSKVEREGIPISTEQGT